ncbi:MAG: phosphopantothenoylcysteine decarboxylase, partial [Oscillospiraceae bacterium]
TRDILGYLGQHRREGQFLCGFSMETQNVIENSRRKLSAKNIDMICANSLRTEGAGFKSDTNVITVITPEREYPLEMMSKDDAAGKIFDMILDITEED